MADTRYPAFLMWRKSWNRKCAFWGIRTHGFLIRMAMASILRQLFKINPWKTILFNFHYFPFSVAIRMPVFIYWRSLFYQMKGKILIEAPVRTGMVKFGAHGLRTQDIKFARTIWEMRGTLIIKGQAKIGRGSKINVGKDATLTLGDHFDITGNTSIVCQKAITFGNDCLLSWDCLFMDTDFHHIITLGNVETINHPKPIAIGNHVWIGCRNTILKGVSIADNNVVSACSTITRSVTETNCIIAGHGKSVEIIKRGIDWKA